jgi:DNA topoisomerase IA
LYELGETVNKILDKTKVKKDNTPNLESQLEVIRKELENANKFIEIYKKQLKNIQKSESASAQLQTIAQSEEMLKAKQR